eukprot:TRINITY_DN4325_c0_g2_i4.p6 TRINITY_DN4325_c0_g2~~TRINITY_DN4325_c0_g2_i4.p6  ORF type:complete len:113 (+),score=20.56 TRINITY_DN4325_c0_g2_i4:424-762(+)
MIRVTRVMIIEWWGLGQDSEFVVFGDQRVKFQRKMLQSRKGAITKKKKNFQIKKKKKKKKKKNFQIKKKKKKKKKKTVSNFGVAAKADLIVQSQIFRGKQYMVQNEWKLKQW